jgi:hypothetical protein
MVDFGFHCTEQSEISGKRGPGKVGQINPKLQSPNTREAPSQNLQMLCAGVVNAPMHDRAEKTPFEVWSLRFLWSLALGIWSF